MVLSLRRWGCSGGGVGWEEVERLGAGASCARGKYLEEAYAPRAAPGAGRIGGGLGWDGVG